MKHTKLFYVTLLGLILGLSGSIAQGKSGKVNSRSENNQIQSEASVLSIPNEHELVGYWEKLPTPSEVSDMFPTDPWPYAYQWFSFGENGEYVALMSHQFHRYTDKKLSQLLQKSINPDYAYEYVNGYLLVNFKKEKQQQVWHVTKVNTSGKYKGFSLVAGDMLMTLVNGQALREKRFEPITIRHMRKVATKSKSSEKSGIDI